MRYEKVIGQDVIRRKIVIFRYEDGGKIYHDLLTDGRILLTPKLAKKLATELEKFAATEGINERNRI